MADFYRQSYASQSYESPRTRPLHRHVLAKASTKQQRRVPVVLGTPTPKGDQLADVSDGSTAAKTSERDKDAGAKMASCHKFSAVIGGLVETPCDTGQGA